MGRPDRRKFGGRTSAVLIMLLLIPSFAGAGDRKPKGVFAFFIENDVFALSDGGYTNGVDLTWLSPALGPAGRVPRWLNALSRRFSLSRDPGTRRFVSVGVDLSMYTPEDITRRDLVADDRPYAGVFRASLGFHLRRGSFMDSFRFEAGIVGPHSFAGDIQKFFHRTFGWTYPEGWEHQLKDEPFLAVAYDRRWKVRAAAVSAGLDWELIGHAGGDFSNLFTGLGGGLEVRAGWKLPSDFGTSLLGPASGAGILFEDREWPRSGPGHTGFYLFAGIEAHAVARDLLLDGNTFRSSPRVDKIPFTADITTGLSLRHKRLKASMLYAYQTRRFRGQRLKPLIGSLNLALLF
jgi:lipid A 3-O-deacylase